MEVVIEQAQTYFDLRRKKADLEAELSEVKASLAVTEKELVLYMENQNLQSFNDKTFGTIYLREQVYARVDNESSAFGWFDKHQMGDIIKRTVHNKTLCAICKEHPEIPGVVATWETKIGYRRA